MVCEGSPEGHNKAGTCVSDGEIHSVNKDDDCTQETNDTSTEENDAHFKQSLDQDFGMTLGITEEELQLMETMGKIQCKKDDEAIEVSFKHQLYSCTHLSSFKRHPSLHLRYVFVSWNMTGIQTTALNSNQQLAALDQL